MTKPKLTPEDLRSIFLDLQSASLDAVVVGGQAVNLWATKYCDRKEWMLDANRIWVSMRRADC